MLRKVSYKSIAKLVHEYVKNSESTLSQEKRLSEKEVNTTELAIIHSVFSKYEVSGDVMMFEVIPLRSWV
jgi:hypothetical protein